MDHSIIDLKHYCMHTLIDDKNTVVGIDSSLVAGAPCKTYINQLSSMSKSRFQDSTISTKMT
jgi:hypothetical protein